jgi:hypothetical protein
MSLVTDTVSFVADKHFIVALGVSAVAALGYARYHSAKMVSTANAVAAKASAEVAKVVADVQTKV